ncbi:MAG: hypothetical protein LBI42_00005 [Chitinispirillales bacterium]|jgi:hypothetical protein|nr:hypothetical protein [Chitinispirillales bacterium]
MLLTEWKFEDALKVREEEAWEAARKATREETEKKAIEATKKLLAEQGIPNAEEFLKKLRKSLGED